MPPSLACMAAWSGAKVTAWSGRMADVIWGLAAVLCLLVLLLYRRMLTSVTAYVPARTHLSGWRSLDVSNGSDTWVFLAFAASFFALLALDVLLAIVWMLVVLAGMEAFRRRHNGEPFSQ